MIMVSKKTAAGFDGRRGGAINKCAKARSVDQTMFVNNVHMCLLLVSQWVYGLGEWSGTIELSRAAD